LRKPPVFSTFSRPFARPESLQSEAKNTDKLRVKNRFFSYLSFSFFLWTLSCAPLKNSKYEEFLSLKYEIEPCTTNHVYASSISVGGSAVYYKRGVNLVVQNAKLLNMTLGDPMASPLPIRAAEVVVYDGNNQVVQCGTTDDNGLFTALDGSSPLEIPKTAGTYNIRVYSRINKTLTFSGKPNFDMNVSVKKDKYTNELYYIQSGFYSDGANEPSVTLTAYARQSESLEVTAGAFNILNALYSGYDFIRSNTGTVNTTCLNDKLNVYWKAGFNPYQYYYPESDPSSLESNSYYDDRDSTLYITGGRLGNINIERTDHFGDYVILHEFAHHIENKCGSLLTPGGTHAVLSRIDPRLAWAEGWANYFSAAVNYASIDTLLPEFRSKMAAAGFSNTNWTYFFASVGFSDSVQNIGNGSGFMFDLKKDGKNPDTWQTGPFTGIQFDRVDPSKYPGEGHFREGAITRGLFKLSENCGSGGTCIDSVSGTPISFSSMWKSMDKISGIGRSNYPYKSSESFLEVLKNSILGAASWDSSYRNFNQLTTSEALHLFSDGAYTSGTGTTAVTRWIPYGTPLTTKTSGTCSSGSYYIEPRPDDPVLTATNSDQRYSNHYYVVDLNQLSNVDEINVSFSKVTSAGTNTEFDILLYKEGYFFNIDEVCSTYKDNECTAYTPSRGITSDVVKSDRRSGAISTKTIRGLSSLDKNVRYLMNIRAYTANKSINSITDYQYSITDQTGATLCP
jgi:hypothetical protein